MAGPKKSYEALKLAILALGVSFTGCSGGSTDGGEAADENFQGSEYVDDDSAGTIDLVLNDESFGVSDTSAFRVKVRNASGGPATNLAIACDTEQGLAIVEPTTGRETTDSNGEISGIIGCARPGSFLIACRLPISGNKRDTETVVCTGDIPDGFSGFTGAAGGGLGGGVSVSDPDDPDGSPGGSDPSNSITVSDIDVFDVGTDPVFSVDTDQNVDCDGDNTTQDPEAFVENSFTASIENDANQRVTFTSYSFRVASTYTSPSFSTNVAVDGNGGTATISGLLTTSNPKVFVGGSTAVPSGSRNITFTFLGTTEAGDDVTVSGSVAVNFTNIDNCG